MPDYYFEVNRVEDRDGIMLSDLKAARAEARRILSMLLKGTDIGPGECKSWSCVLRDEHGKGLARVVLATLVEDLTDQPGATRTFQPV